MSEEVDDIGADIAKAMEETEPSPVETPVESPEKPDGRDEKGRFASKVEVVEPVVVKDPPPSWTPHKDKFSTLPVDVQELIRNREEEVHKGFTKLDEDRNFGKQLKEIINPYMPQIVSEGGDPAKAVQSLLNTAYQLRTADPQTKAQLVSQIIQQYGVDMRYLQNGQEQQVDPRLNSVLQEVNSLKQTLGQQQQLQQQQETAKIQQEYQAFAAKPENAHANHPEVKAEMASLLQGGRAQSYQDAYDKAIWTVPEIRSTLMSAQDQEAKRKAEFASKKVAGSSVTGSPGITVANTGPAPNPNANVDEDVRAAMAQHGW